MNDDLPTDRSLSAPQLTWRAAGTGAVLGALLVPCNVYSGLKIGWSFNMSIAAALLSCGFWGAWRRVAGTRRVAHWGLLENNINQTCASSAASIISSGLAAPIPALTLLTGQTLSWPAMSFWLLAVSSVGVVAGLALRRQMIEVQQLPFPSGVATAETVREIYASGREAMVRVRALLGAGVFSAAVKLVNEFFYKLPQLGPAMAIPGGAGAKLTLSKLGFVLDPSFLMVGFGAIVGLRVGLSLLLGAIVAWGALTPWLVATERIAIPPDETVFAIAVEWLLWPGVALMVCSALTSFACSIPGVIRGWTGASDAEDENDRNGDGSADSDTMIPAAPVGPSRRGVPTRWLIRGFVASLLLAVVAQYFLFGIHPAMAVLAVAVTFVLAVVDARVSGETGIPPIGALGKVTQLMFGFIHPASVSVNLMTANVTGGAAGQCSDMLHDLKAGRLLGASVNAQAAAQCLGVLVGSLAGSAAYLAMVPDAASMLLTKEWPAPAVRTWKAVAELFRDGLESAPADAMTASLIGAGVGIGLALWHRFASLRVAHWIPSPASMGLAFVIPAFNSLSLFLGALLAALAHRVAPEHARRLALPVAAGLVAGESLAGVGHALFALFSAP